MQREIKFRGKRTDNGELVYGFYYHSTINNRNYIADLVDTRSEEIIPESVGQFTGLKDKNGKEIYEGDIVNVYDISPNRISGMHVIEWWNGQFVFRANSNEEDDFINFGWWVKSNSDQIELSQMEVIGNLYETPELIKGGRTK